MDDENMIRHAATVFVNIAYDEGWARYKLKYQCNNSCQELCDRFWTEIRPNLDNYRCVTDDPTLRLMIEHIPGPDQLLAYPVIGDSNSNVHTTIFPQSYEEEAARMKSMTLARKDIIQIRDTAINGIRNHPANSQSVVARTAASSQSSRQVTGAQFLTVGQNLTVGQGNASFPYFATSPLPNTSTAQ